MRKAIALIRSLVGACKQTAANCATVTRGMRVASFFRLQSMIRDAYGRSLIFDLVTGIQALLERLGRR